MAQHCTRIVSTRGFSALEVLFSLGLVATLITVAVPLTTDAADDFRTAMAARYVAGRIVDARMQAVSRSAHVGLRFERSGSDYVFATYADGNADGVRTADITNGTDRPITTPERLADNFRGVKFGLAPELPDADGVRGNPEGVRLGAARILTMSPDGTATSGTLYIQGRRGQYAVRVLGATARTRVLVYDRGGRQWMGQ